MPARLSRIHWGTDLTGVLELGFPLQDYFPGRVPREGSQSKAFPSGARDAWLGGRDYALHGSIAYIPTGGRLTNPAQTEWGGPAGVQAFLDWCYQGGTFTLQPDTASPYEISGCRLLDPDPSGRSAQGEADGTRRLPVTVLHESVDLSLAMRGLLFALRPGADITDLVGTFTRADATTCATYRDRDGYWASAPANQLRVTWVDLDGDGIFETPGFLFESARTNRCLRSTEFEHGDWVKNDVTVNANNGAAFPDRFSTISDVVVAAAGTAIHRTYQECTGLTAGPQCFSVGIRDRSSGYARIQIYNATDGIVAHVAVNLLTGAIVSSTGNAGTIKDKDGFWRVWCSAAITVTSTYVHVIVTDATGAESTTMVGTEAIDVAHAQLEAGHYPTSLIRTTSAAVTRAVDTLEFPITYRPNLDITLYARIARPAWADATGSFSPATAIQIGGAASADFRINLRFLQGSRSWRVDIDAGVIVDRSTAIPSGAVLAACAQFATLTTGGTARLDVGSGFSALSSAATPFSAWGANVLHVGNGPAPLDAVLLEVSAAYRLLTLSEIAVA